MISGDHAEDDRAVEVDHRAPDLGPVLELPLAHRLRRAVEAGQVGEHDDGPPAAGGVDRARDLLGRAREQRARAPLLRTVGREHAVALQRPRLDAEHRDRPAAEVGVPDHRRLGALHRRSSARAARGRRRWLRASRCGCRTAACARDCVSSEKTSPMRANADWGAWCGASRDVAVGRVGGGRPAREALARRHVGVLVVAEEDSAGPGHVGGPVLRLAVGAHDPLVAADAEVVLGRDRRPSSRGPACRSGPSRSTAS